MSEISYDAEQLTPVFDEVETSAKAVAEQLNGIVAVDAGAATEVISDILTQVIETAGSAATSMGAVASTSRAAIHDLQATEAEIVESLRVLGREGE